MMHIGSLGHAGGQEEVSIRSLVRVNRQTQVLLLLTFCHWLQWQQPLGEIVLGKAKLERKITIKSHCLCIFIANESIKYTVYPNNCMFHLIQFLSFSFFSVPFTRQHHRFLGVHCLPCPAVLSDVLLGKFGWGGFKIQMFNSKAKY